MLHYVKKPKPLPRPVAVLGVSHRDFGLARIWMTWAVFLARQEGGMCAGDHLVIFTSRRVTDAQREKLRQIAQWSAEFFELTVTTCPDECEDGYPRSASHLFERSLEFCEREFPGRSVLWIEPDAIPTKPGWFDQIADEYVTLGKPFMGVYVEKSSPHMSGNAVYPHNWRKLAPAIVDSVTAPGPKTGPSAGMMGQPWDIWAGPQIIPQMSRCTSIQHVWRPPVFDEKNLLTILKPETALFHQNKDSTFMNTLAKLKYPRFLAESVSPSAYFAVLGSQHQFRLGHVTISFKPCALGPGGSAWGVYRPKSLFEEYLLTDHEGRFGIKRVPQEEYNALLAQA